jgi:hypothetical protein
MRMGLCCREGHVSGPGLVVAFVAGPSTHLCAGPAHADPLGSSNPSLNSWAT